MGKARISSSLRQAASPAMRNSSRVNSRVNSRARFAPKIGRRAFFFEQGFTLIELLLATILFSASFFPIMDTLASSTVSLSENNLFMDGWLKAKNSFERVLSATFDFLEVGEETVTVGEEEYPFVVSDEQEGKIRVVVQVGFADENNEFTYQTTDLKKVDARLFLKRGKQWDLALTFYALKSRRK